MMIEAGSAIELVRLPCLSALELVHSERNKKGSISGGIIGPEVISYTCANRPHLIPAFNLTPSVLILQGKGR